MYINGAMLNNGAIWTYTSTEVRWIVEMCVNNVEKLPNTDNKTNLHYFKYERWVEILFYSLVYISYTF